ncbi:FG-GAP and VCBS repeat-containing protein [Sphaerisporangium aureirubrum]|uniref:FG-GAP and VCBS repeat-containing protein n=1 Tax=Sphaerisporangium aureirubrum TaxID=1544736 RepID=A0ABW1NMM1_9ACTN
MRSSRLRAGLALTGVLALCACGPGPAPAPSPQAGPSTAALSPSPAGPSTAVPSPSPAGPSGTPASPSPPVSVSVPAREVPRGTGSTLTDDVNGDGYADAVIVSERRERNRFLTVLYGSAGGLDPERRTVVEAGDGVLWTSGGSWRARRPDTADLDGDGFADIPVLLRTEGDWPALRILWGGPLGPAEDGLSPVVPVPDAERVTSDWPAAGDFDGDGHADLALGIPDLSASGSDGGGYVLLHGPFGREGAPRDTYVGQSPRTWWVVADRMAPGRRNMLVVHDGDDGEQTGAVILPRVPPAARTYRLGPGNAIATGDFDGDGTVDVAVGDDGGRNDEPGYETLGETGAVTVHYGRAPETPVVMRVPRIRGKLTAGDVDGDGRDDLVLQSGDRVEVRTHGLSTTRTLGELPCPPGKLPQFPVAVRAGDYDRDGRAEVLLNCWSYIFGPDPQRWWMWRADGPGVRFDTTGF